MYGTTKASVKNILKWNKLLLPFVYLELKECSFFLVHDGYLVKIH